jgi:hypothetical protein
MWFVFGRLLVLGAGFFAFPVKPAFFAEDLEGVAVFADVAHWFLQAGISF